jgi:hypothetical protein
MPTARPGDLALILLLICQDAPPPDHEGRAMEFGAQDKAAVLHPGVPEGERSVRFALGIVARPAAGGGVDFVGPFVHGVPQGRFLYLGYRPLGETVWTRRWKIPLAALTLFQVLAAHEGGKSIVGRVSAGSTSTVRLLGLGWSVTGGSAQETVSGSD